jgi:outer membrane protein insertion porin family
VGFAELTQGNFDLFNWPSFTGGGQKFRLRLQYGTERKDFLLTITEPYFLDRRLALTGQAFYNEANYLSADYDQRNYGFMFELRKPITAYMYGTLGYMLQNVEIFNVASSSPEFILTQAGTFTESKMFSSLVLDTRDNPLLSRRGQRITFSPSIAGGFLGGDVQIYAWDLEGSQYFRLPKDTILLLNGEIATVSQWGTGNEVPIFERLFLGGSNNLRGFEFRDVGPKDKRGEPLGGQSMARATVELTFPIIEKARGALFYDTGFVNVNPWDYNFNDLSGDIGFGLRLDLPIGPLRIDYGIPVQSPHHLGGGKINFNVGYQF